jgi:hypothetical protein
VKREIENLNTYDLTNFEPALDTAIAMLKNGRPDALHAILLLSDGIHNIGLTRDDLIEKFSKLFVDNKIYCNCIGFGADNDYSLLGQLSEKGNGRYSYASENIDMAECVFQYLCNLQNTRCTDICVKITLPDNIEIEHIHTDYKHSVKGNEIKVLIPSISEGQKKDVIIKIKRESSVTVNATVTTTFNDNNIPKIVTKHLEAEEDVNIIDSQCLRIYAISTLKKVEEYYKQWELKKNDQYESEIKYKETIDNDFINKVEYIINDQYNRFKNRPQKKTVKILLEDINRIIKVEPGKSKDQILSPEFISQVQTFIKSHANQEWLGKAGRMYTTLPQQNVQQTANFALQIVWLKGRSNSINSREENEIIEHIKNYSKVINEIQFDARFNVPTLKIIN